MNGEPPEHPLLVLPEPRRGERSRRGGGGGGIHYPEPSRQAQRLGPRFQGLQDGFAARRAEILTDIAGADPEQVLVLETIGTVEDFINAVQRIEGLEFLAELDEDDIPPDDDFFSETDAEKALSGTVYLLMTNQQAMEQLLSLWRRFVANPDARFEHGLGRFRQLFRLLRDVRPWGPEDRLRDTGVLDDWRARIALGEETVPVEIEFWFRDDEQTRAGADAEVRRYVDRAAGQVIATAVIPEIRYHALLARLPVQTVEPLAEIQSLELVRSERVMLLRPTGQTVTSPEVEASLPQPVPEEATPASDVPIVALLDGTPLEQHTLLADRLVFDDPDDFAADAPANLRHHGTAIASLIVHGDLGAGDLPLHSRLYMRPILKPGPAWVASVPERVPDDTLVVDLIHRAVRRIYEGDLGTDPVAPSVRVINLSVGDDNAPFVRMMSAWARLLDWLAWRYRTLFVVSAGNHPGELRLDVEAADVPSTDGAGIEAAALRALADASEQRRILPPAEAVNVLTVGASHNDAATAPTTGPTRELIASPSLLAPYSALGLGFRRAIKPEILIPGGRRLYALAPAGADGTSFLGQDPPRSPPGQLVASPIGPPGGIAGQVYRRGTSNAAALATRAASQLHDLLGGIEAPARPDFLGDDGVVTCLLKALLVHGAEFGEADPLLRTALGDRVQARKFREYATRFVGYGSVDLNRSFGSSESRVTLIGGGYVGGDEAAEFEIPLPPTLSGKAGRRRVTITLGWLTPTNARHHRYRRALVWVEPSQNELSVRRIDADWQAVQRGTVQHEVLEGTQAAVFGEDDSLPIRVNCAEYAGNLEDPVPYGLVVSLEVAPELNVPVFTEVRDRIRPLVVIRPAI